MSDQPSPPPKPKPGSLRDRIAAFEKSSTQQAAPAPPPPRPKPAGFASWKPKPPSPPSTPPATADGPSSASASASPSSAPGVPPKPSGMSASDAKESISKGGSLKERMAALQGRGAFGAPPPPPVAPKPAVERPKWKPPPVVHAPVDDDADQGTGSSTAVSPPARPPVAVGSLSSSAGLAGIAAAVERTISPPSVTKSPESMDVGEAAEGGGSGGAGLGVTAEGGEQEEEGEKVVDPEEEERQRRAAIAARMARLGGARVGMAPPLFGPKPPVRRPTQDQAPKEPVKAPEPRVEEPAKVEELTSTASPPVAEAAAVPLPPSDHTSPTPSENVRSPEILPTRKSSDAASITSIEPSLDSHTAPKPPTSMPVPAVPRRTGPPRRKVPKPAPAADIPEEPKVEEASPVIPPPQVEEEPKPTEVISPPETQPDTKLESPEADKAILEDIQKEEPEEVQSDEPSRQLTTGDELTEPDPTPVSDAIVPSPPSPIQPESLIESLARADVALTTPSPPQLSPPGIAPGSKVEEEEEEDKDSVYSDRDEQSPPKAAFSPEPTPTPQPKVVEEVAVEEAEPAVTSPAATSIPPVDVEEDEDEEEARRKRVADRLAKIGGVNPFALPAQRLERKSSVGSSPPAPAPPLSTSPPVQPESTPSHPAQSPPASAEKQTEEDASDEDDQSVYEEGNRQSNVNPSVVPEALGKEQKEEGVHEEHPEIASNPFAAALASSTNPFAIAALSPSRSSSLSAQAPPSGSPPSLPPTHSRPSNTVPPQPLQVRKYSVAEDEDDGSEYGSSDRHASPAPEPPVPGRSPLAPPRPSTTSTSKYQHQNPAQPPRRIVPQTPAESEEDEQEDPEKRRDDDDDDDDSDLANSQLASSQHLFVRPPPALAPGAYGNQPSPGSRLRQQHRQDEDDDDGQEPLPMLHRRSKTGESLDRERRKEEEGSGKFAKEPYASEWEESQREEDEEDEPESDHGGEALPVPPRRVPSASAGPPSSPPPPVPVGTRPMSIASPRANVPPRTTSRVPDIPPAGGVDAPTLSVEGGEILSEDEGDPIDPSFHSPSRRGSFSSLRPGSAAGAYEDSGSGLTPGATSGHLSPTPPLPAPPTAVQAGSSPSTSPVPAPAPVPVARSPPLPPAPAPAAVGRRTEEDVEEDPEQARRKTIAERMAKLGGIKFGAAPPLGLGARPAVRRQDSERSEHAADRDASAETPKETGEGAEDVPEAASPPRELTEEEEEKARKERIAAKLAGMGGMRIGMMPMGMGMPPRPKSHVLRDEDESTSTPPPLPPARAIPPARPPPTRAPPPPVSPPPAPHDPDSDDKASDDGVKVEAEESEIEEVNYEDFEEAREPSPSPPPVPSRASRPTTVHRKDSTVSPPPVPPAGRPPVPSGVFRRPSAGPPATPSTSPPLAQKAPTSEYVMVEEPQKEEEEEEEEEAAPPPPPPARPSAHRLPPSSSRNTMTYPPPPGGDNSLTSQWELPSIPTSSLDFGMTSGGAGQGGANDLSMSWTDAGESLPAAHQARLQQQEQERQRARMSMTSDGGTSATSPRLSQFPQSPPPPAAAVPPSPNPPRASERRLSADDLMVVWGRVGVQLCEVATTLYEKSKKQLIGDGTYVGFVENVLQGVPNAACDPSTSDWGYVIYQQNGPAVVKRASEIMPGDIVEISEGKLKGHKGLQTYHQNVGGGGDVLVGVVGEFEAKKSKIRVFHANQHVGQQTVESVSYRLEDLKSGTVKVYRVLEAEA